MKTISVSEAKMKLSGLLDAIAVSDEEILITKNGRPAAVLVSPEEFDSWRETFGIRSDADFMKEIHQGKDELRQKRSSLYTLDELFQ